jgi:hypothetical protein
MDFPYISKIHFLVRKRVKPIRFKCVISISAAEVNFCFAFEISIDDALLSVSQQQEAMRNVLLLHTLFWNAKLVRYYLELARG